MLAEGGEATGIPFSSSNLEEDTELVELARNAARSHHQLKGIPYDESTPIDLYTDIKFSVVELKLPLGRKCWVSCLSDTFSIIFSLIAFFLVKCAVVFLENAGKL